MIIIVYIYIIYSYIFHIFPWDHIIYSIYIYIYTHKYMYVYVYIYICKNPPWNCDANAMVPMGGMAISHIPCFDHGTSNFYMAMFESVVV